MTASHRPARLILVLLLTAAAVLTGCSIPMTDADREATKDLPKYHPDAFEPGLRW